MRNHQPTSYMMGDNQPSQSMRLQNPTGLNSTFAHAIETTFSAIRPPVSFVVSSVSPIAAPVQTVATLEDPTMSTRPVGQPELLGPPPALQPARQSVSLGPFGPAATGQLSFQDFSQSIPSSSHSLVTPDAHAQAADAAAQEPTVVVVQPSREAWVLQGSQPGVPTSVVTAQASRGVGAAVQSPQLVNPLQLPDVQAAMVELRIKYEVEKARRETLEAVVNNRMSPVGEQGLPRMGDLSGFDLNHSILNQQGVVGTAHLTGGTATVPGQVGPGVQGRNREKPINQLVHLTESSPLPPGNPARPVATTNHPSNEQNRTRTYSNSSQESHASSVAPSNASLSSASARKYKMKKPEVFSGASTPEGFDRFIRLFQLHLRSHGCEDPEEWVDILEGFLGDTPALVYTQLRRDQPSISFEEVVRELRICFGRPLDARMARHKIHDVTWTPGESLTQLATRIRDLHFQAHSKTPFEEREAYAGDTFYRLLPQEWRLRIRDKNLSSLSEYLSAAIECEDRDREMKQSALKSHPIRPLAESFSSSELTPVMNTTDQPQIEHREQTNK